MDQNQPQSGTTNGTMNEWRNGIPIYQHFSAPSTTYVNMFRQPGVYNITIGLPGSVARMNPTTAPPSRIPNRQTGMPFGPHNPVNVGGGPMTQTNYSHEGQIRQITTPGAPMQGNGLGVAPIPLGARTPQNKPGEPPMMMTPTPDYNSREGQMGEEFPPTPPASIVTSPVIGPHFT